MAESNKILSVQLSLDGLYFSVRQGNSILVAGYAPFVRDADGCADIAGSFEREPIAGDYSRINVIADTDKVVFVPEEFFSSDLAGSYIKTNKIPLSEGEIAIGGVAVEGVVPVMVVKGEVLSAISVLCEDVRFYSPMQTNLICRQSNSIYVNISDVISITVNDHNLKYAAVLPLASRADILYHTESIMRRYGSKGRRIEVGGRNVADYVKMLKKYYRKVRVDLPAGLRGDAKRLARDSSLNNVIMIAYADSKR